jgi:hypothetical protein
MTKTGRQGKAAARTIGKELSGSAAFSDTADLLGTLDKMAAKAADTPLESQILAARSQIAEGLTEAAEAASPELAGAYSQASASHEIASALHEGAKAEAGRLASKAADSPFSSMGGSLLGALAGVATGSIGVGAIASVVGAIGQSAAKTMIQKRGASALIRLADHVAAATSRIESASQSLAGLKAAPAIASTSVGTADFGALRSMLAETATDPGKLHAKIEAAIAPVARQQPEVAMHMARQIAGDHAWLASKVPAAMGAKQSLTPSAEPRPVPPAAQKKLVSYAKALADPISVLEGMSHGRVDWDGLEAVKARRPELWDSMRSSVMYSCAQASETLPFRRKMMLSLAFDFQADPSLGRVAAIQASGQGPPPPVMPPSAAPQQAPSTNVRAAAISSAADETEIHAAVGDAA